MGLFAFSFSFWAFFSAFLDGGSCEGVAPAPEVGGAVSLIAYVFGMGVDAVGCVRELQWYCVLTIRSGGARQ